MPKMPTTWVLVADGGRARVLASRGPGKGFDVVIERSADLQRTSELGTERPGRSFESATTAHHAYEAPDYHRAQEQAFLQAMARELDAERKGRRFDKLVVVAPPVALGMLRKALGRALREIVGAEIDKDLTKVGLHELPAHLRDVVPC